MSNSTYKAQSQNFHELFESEFKGSTSREGYSYFIPKYQRPYSWNKNLINILWEDILYTIKDKDFPNIYFGSIVFNYSNNELINSNEPSYGQIEVVDGQQRLVTLTILLSVIRDVCFQIYNHNPDNQRFWLLAHQIQQDYLKHNYRKKSYLEVRDSIHSYKTEKYKSKKLFDQHIIKFKIEKEYTGKTKKMYERHLTHGRGKDIVVDKKNYPLGRDTLHNDSFKYRDNYRTLYINLNDSLKKISKVKAIKEIKSNDNVYNFIHKVFTVVTQKLRFTKIEIEKEYEAYEYFESINSKKLELNASDLIRNQLFKILDKAKHSSVQKKWDQIEENINYLSDYRNVKITFVDFLVYFWSSKYSYISSRKLYKEIIETFKDEATDPATKELDKEALKSRWLEFINNVSLASKFLKLSYMNDNKSALKNQFPFIGTKEHKHLYESLYFLSRTSSKTWIILILCLFRHYKSLHADYGLQDIASKFLPLFNKFTFFYFNILSQPTNWYHKELYNTSHKIENHLKDSNKYPVTPKELLGDLLKVFYEKTKEIDAVAFSQSLKDNVYYKSSEASKTNIRSILHIYETILPNGSSDYKFDEPSVINIEHIFPQKYNQWIAPKKMNDLSEDVRKKNESRFNSLGNLMLLYYRSNGSVGNNKIDEKISKYKEKTPALQQSNHFIDHFSCYDLSYKPVFITDRSHLPDIDVNSQIFVDFKEQIADPDRIKHYLKKYGNKYVFLFKDAEKLDFTFNIKLRQVYITTIIYNHYKDGFKGKLTSVYQN